MDWPGGGAVRPVISPWSPESLGIQIRDSATAAGAIQTIFAWPSANLAIFVPFTIAAPFPMQSVW